MKKILGLDLGSNSIGAALINIPKNVVDFGKEGNIEWLGSRIIPMEGFVSTKTGKAFKESPTDSFSKGVGISKNAARRIKRGARRLKQRYILRRTRLVRVLKTLCWLDEKFPENFKDEMRNNGNFKFRISDFLPCEEETIKEAKEFLGTKNSEGEIKLPEDWIVYYLRKKGLTQKLSFAELARLIYMMNQRRGFKSSRKDLKDGSSEEKKWVEILKIKSVEQITFESDKNKNFEFKISAYNELINTWTVKKKKKPEWEEKEYTCLITEKIETKKDGSKKITQNAPKVIDDSNREENWELCVTALHNQMGDKFPGEYFFDGLVKSVRNKTDFKIRQYAVFRKKYKAELETIWQKQLELNEDLRRINSDKNLLKKLAEILYPKQTELGKPKLKEVLSHDLLHLISEDIIYYQRELKSQKSSKSECKYEKKKGIDGEFYGLKCAPKSSPEFQEFRIWQDIHNIKVLQRDGTETKTLRNGETKEFNIVDIDVTTHYVKGNVKEKLFELFDNSKEVNQNQIIDIINLENPENKISDKTHRINMFFDGKEKLLGNETKDYFRKIFKKCDYETEGEIGLSNREKFYRLWQITYSISLNDEEKAKLAITKALSNNTNKRGKSKKITFDFPCNVVEAIANAPEIESTKKYASYSAKAINKLLPLMRCGKYWDETLIHNDIKQKVENIESRLDAINHNVKKIQSVSDDEIPQQILTSFINQENYLSGLKTYQACYLIYDRHSERTDFTKYSAPQEFDIMKLLPNNSLGNPVVEQVIRESLFVVKDLWQKYGQPDEIHIEMSRDLKKNAKEREKATKSSTNNFEERKRIKALLKELMNEEFEQYVNDGDEKDENGEYKIKKEEKIKFETKPNPDSPVDIDKFRLWKSGVNEADYENGKKWENIVKDNEIKKYALWLSQKCISPYTGKLIPLSKLFTDKYEKEHILPRGLIKYDSNENLVIAERDVNKAKDRELAAIFMANKNGSCEYGGLKYKLLDYDSYVTNCKNIFKGKKLKNLLATEIPDDFISRQINDTRYISRKISELLYPVAKGNPNATTDAEKGGIVFTIGSITSDLKNEWGLTKVWKQLMKPRFERLEKINSEKYIFENENDRNDFYFNIESEDDKKKEELNVKRIDHRHHALDALVIAATTIEHIRYLNSLNAVDTNEELQQVKRALVKGKIREFQLPWEKFTKEAKEHLQQLVVTLKPYNQVFTKPKNKYTKWVLENGEWIKKANNKQEKPKEGKQWLAIRKSLFKEPQGIVHIKEIVTKELKNLNDILSVIKLQLERDAVQNKPTQKTTSYIYDQDYREDFKEIIKLCGGDFEKIKQHLAQYLKRHKTLKDINGEPIRKVRIVKFVKYAAKRVKLDNSFDHKKIDKIPYGDRVKMSENKKLTIPQILHEHISEYEQFVEQQKELKDKQQNLLSLEEKEFLEKSIPKPFSEEGLEALDKKVGMKIRMVTIKEDVGIKKSLQGKLIESDSNSYYTFYENEITGERLGFTSLSTYDVIQRKLKNEPLIDKKEGYKTIILQANDLVYVPTKEEIETKIIDWDNKKQIAERLYRVNDFSKTDIYFIPNSYAQDIIGTELHKSAGFKTTRLVYFPTSTDDNPQKTQDSFVMIKEVCIKVEFNRLGNIKPFIN